MKEVKCKRNLLGIEKTYLYACNLDVQIRLRNKKKRRKRKEIFGVTGWNVPHERIDPPGRLGLDDAAHGGARRLGAAGSAADHLPAPARRPDAGGRARRRRPHAAALGRRRTARRDRVGAAGGPLGSLGASFVLKNGPFIAFQ